MSCQEMLNEGTAHQILHQREHADGKLAQEKMYKLTSHEGNANENLRVIMTTHLLGQLVNIKYSTTFRVGM